MTTPVGKPAWSRQVSIGTYDGAADKIACDTEETPYAWTWYQELGGMLGSGFSPSQTGYVHSLKIAGARTLAVIDRAAEKLPLNALPGTADEALSSWVYATRTFLRGDETRQEIRQRAAARFKASKGPTWTNIDTACSELLGDVFVKVHRNYGATLSAPPDPTYWPGINPGPSSYDMGGGAWISPRCHVVVEVQRTPDLDDGAFLNLVNVDLFRLLDELLPAYATFNWATGLTSGFNLDVDQLDYTGMTAS